MPRTGYWASRGSKEKSLVMKYTVTLLGKWDEERASEPNALNLRNEAKKYFVFNESVV
jgi:hypothetical protein